MNFSRNPNELKPNIHHSSRKLWISILCNSWNWYNPKRNSSHGLENFQKRKHFNTKFAQRFQRLLRFFSKILEIFFNKFAPRVLVCDMQCPNYAVFFSRFPKGYFHSRGHSRQFDEISRMYRMEWSREAGEEQVDEEDPPYENGISFIRWKCGACIHRGRKRPKETLLRLRRGGKVTRRVTSHARTF